jgi:Mg-chelatase subunit ChlD
MKSQTNNRYRDADKAAAQRQTKRRAHYSCTSRERNPVCALTQLQAGLPASHIGRLLANSFRSWPMILSTFACLAASQPLLAKGPPADQSKPRIEVCFVLDTTGSMGGLIEGAKQKIWSIANEMISAKPTPQLKLGLIGYRDRGDEYVVKSFNLTDDIDAIYGHLREFQAGGGGDTPESVNEALDEAIHKMAWSDDHKVLKIIFLVGDAPPHMDYPNSPKYPDLCREAAKKDLIINTVQCGDMAETRTVWQEIAKLSEGSYAAIAQSGNMAVVSTPMDKELAKLNERIGETLIPVRRQQTPEGSAR